MLKENAFMISFTYTMVCISITCLMSVFFLIEMSFKPFTMTISIITVVLKFLFGKAGEMFILVDNVVDHHLSFFLLLNKSAETHNNAF